MVIASRLKRSIIHEQPGRHHLDRYFPVQRYLVSQEDGRHAPTAELPADLELAERGLPQPLDHLGPGRLRVVVVGVAPDQRGRVGADRELVTASGAEAVGGADGFAALETDQSGGHQVTELSWRSRCEY